jgi:hypothetical protein
MNDPSHAAPGSRDPLTLFALAGGLAMGNVVVAMATQPTEAMLALPSALAFVVCGSAAVLCALAAVPRPRWVAPRLGRWIMAIAAGLLGSMAPALLF